VEQYRCGDCGRELFDFGDGPPPTRCEDCVPETGAGSPFVEQLATNIRRLRHKAGVEREELARRAGLRVEDVRISEDAVAEPGVTKALRLAHSLGVSIDELTERVYWNPGEMARRPGDRRLPSERLSGFFLILPVNVPVFDPPPQRDPVEGRQEAAEIFGQNVRAARDRRHLTQTTLAHASGLSKAGLSLTERGICETTIETLLSLARALEVTPGLLLGGIVWTPHQPSCASAAGRGHAQRHDAHSLDAPIRRFWREGEKAGEIAAALGTSAGAVSAIVHRLREHGEELEYRSPPTRAVHEGARHRRRQRMREASREGDPVAIGSENATDSTGRREATDSDLAARIAVNTACYREAAGLTLRELSEGVEVHQTHLHRIEKGRSGLPMLSLIVKLAASLNVRCERVTEGIVWDPGRGTFKLEEANGEPDTALERLGRNVRRARREIGISQQVLSARAAMSRGDVVDFEHGSRNFRIFTAIRLAGALGVDSADLFSGVADWYVRPLPAPEYGPEDQPPTKVERDALLMRLWREGRPERKIAEAMDLTPGAVGPYVRELRDAGKDLPYRRLPRRPVESAARSRRAENS
jgi:transcriptional regulator with XRE-family HTH domain